MSINTPDVTLSIMSAREELLKENKARIKEEEERISSLMLSLGSRGMECGLSVRLPGCMKLQQDCRNASAERTHAEERLKAIRNASQEHEERRALVESRKKDSAEIASSIDSLLTSLGASIYEKCSFSLLDKDAFAPVYKDQEKPGKGAFGSVLSRLSREHRFRRYGRLVISNDLDAMLDGKARETAEEIRRLQGLKAEADKEKHELLSLIVAKKHSYEALSTEGVERAEKNAKGAAEREEAALRNYGAFLWDNGGSWIGEDTPSVLLDEIERILAEKDALERLIAERKRLKSEAKADDLMALLENEEKKLSILQKERERIDSEIADVEAEAGRLRMKLEEIRREQGM